MNDAILEKYAAAANWPSDLSAAKEFARQAINEWDFKQKAPEFLAKIDRATTIKRLQELIIYSMLSGQGHGVIK